MTKMVVRTAVNVKRNHDAHQQVQDSIQVEIAVFVDDNASIAVSRFEAILQQLPQVPGVVTDEDRIELIDAFLAGARMPMVTSVL